MNIAHVTYAYEPVAGGADVYLRALFALLERAGHSQRVYQRRAESRRTGLRFVDNPLRGLPGEFWTHGAFLWRHWGALALEDALICHYPSYLLACAPVRRLGQVRLVGISHGVTWDDRPGSARSAIKRAAARAAFRRADVFVANDTYFLREMGVGVRPGERAFKQVGRNAWFIPNCVDARRYRGVEPLPHIEALEPVLVPRHLYRNRGVHLAIGAFAEFARVHARAHLLIVGAVGERGYFLSLVKQVKMLGLGGRVIFHGPVPPGDMGWYYASARLVVVPSIAGEGTSLAALESMASGAATVCTRVAGLADLPAAQSAPDPRSLARTMLECYEKREEIGALQQEIVARQFSIERWEQTWLRALESAGIESRQARPR